MWQMISNGASFYRVVDIFVVDVVFWDCL